MSTITAATKPLTSTATRLLHRGAIIAVSAAVLIAAAIALTVWLLVQSPTHHAKVTTPANGQKLGVAGQNGPQCPASAAQRFC